MPSEYIATHSNRVYLKSEIDHPELNEMSEAQIAPVTSLRVSTKRKQLFRQDKTGYRSETPVLGPQRELIEVAMNLYGTGWDGGSTKTPISPVLESGFCAATRVGQSFGVAAVTGSNVTFDSDTNLAPGDALVFGQEMRFVAALAGPRDVTLNAPFTLEPSAGATLQGSAGLNAGDSLRTVSALDTWSPAPAVQRLLTGLVADKLTIEINNDFLEIGMKGYAQNLFDSVSGSGGAGFVFPPAPSGAANILASPIAGHLGQAVVGVDGTRVCTLTEARITIDNNVDPRTDEFGCYGTKAFVLGKRRVTLDMTLFERNDSLSQSLYARAVNNAPVPVMLQVGNQAGAMFGIYLPAVLFAVPEFDDKQARLLWRFQSSLALGAANDEIFIAQR
jgi:hypothetical protein